MTTETAERADQRQDSPPGKKLYTTMKVSTEARHKLGLISEAKQVPLCRVIEEMADEWWARVLEDNILPH